MFKPNFLLSKLIYILFFGLLLLTGCEKQPSHPNEDAGNEGPGVEKDGIVSLVLEEQVVDSTDHRSTHIIDTIFVSETEDSIWIRNAVPFSLPQSQSITMFYKGPLQDMPNYVVIWYTYFIKDRNGKRVQTSAFDLLGHNHGFTMLASTTTQIGKQDSIKGFAFFLDFDDVHKGSGQLSFESGDVKKTLFLQSEKHTAILNSHLKIVDFKVEKNADDLSISSPDYDSFVNLKYDVVWLLQYQAQTDSFYRWANSRMEMGICIEGAKREFRIMSFAPNFVH